jgi:ribonucleoside-diphosphate reductase beta chain
MNVAFDIVDVVRQEHPALWDDALEQQIIDMIKEAIECEMAFAEDTLELGVAGLSARDMRKYLEFVADQRFARLGITFKFGSDNPFTFMELQELDSHTNFFERTVSNYQIGGIAAKAEDIKFDSLDF